MRRAAVGLLVFALPAVLSAQSATDATAAATNLRTTYLQELADVQTRIKAYGHLSEHLGQAIAYARANGVAPPWSAQG